MLVPLDSLVLQYTRVGIVTFSKHGAAMLKHAW